MESLTSLIKVIEKIKPLSQTLKSLHSMASGYITLTTFVELPNCVEEWTKPNSKGKMIWERSWKAFGRLVGQTIKSIVNLIFLFQQFKILGIFVQHFPHLSAFWMGTTQLVNAIDILKNVKEIGKNGIKRKKCLEGLCQWEKMNSLTEQDPQAFSQLVEDKIQKWQIRSEKYPKSTKMDHILAKIQLWKAVQQKIFEKPEVIKELCQTKIKRCEIKKKNLNKQQVQSWLALAATVGYVISLLLPLLILNGWLIQLALYDLSINLLYLFNHFVSKQLNTIALPPLI